MSGLGQAITRSLLGRRWNCFFYNLDRLLRGSSKAFKNLKPNYQRITFRDREAVVVFEEIFGGGDSVLLTFFGAVRGERDSTLSC